MQLLMINLVTDSLPAIALGMEPVEKDVMNQKPKPKNEGLFAHGLGLRIILQGLMFGVISLGGFVIGLEFARTTFGISGTLFDVIKDERALTFAQTLAFMSLALSQTFHAFNMRSDKSLFSSNPFSNKMLNLSTVVSIALLSLVMFVPGLNTAFGLTILPYELYLIGLALAVLPIFVMEIAKLCGLIKHKPIK
jgi:Ca2+-transporting ATPase